jgi:hypothetical protein
LPDFSWRNTPKTEDKCHTASLITKYPYNIPNASSIFQINIKYTNLFYSTALQKLPKAGFLVFIWQPWPSQPFAVFEGLRRFGWDETFRVLGTIL